MGCLKEPILPEESLKDFHMSQTYSQERTLPDISSHTEAENPIAINFVGMEKVEIPIVWKSSEGELRLPARVRLLVNLVDPKAKGIHMSRLYKTAVDSLTQNALTPKLVEEILTQMVQSQGDLSNSAELIIDFETQLRRPALKTNGMGWRIYPVRIAGLRAADSTEYVEIKYSIQYSSTCPCSAALARSLNREKFESQFKEEPLDRQAIGKWIESSESHFAIPHSQKSVADVKLQWRESVPDEWKLEEFIDGTEKAIKTPVQTYVKREDEQEFARLNGLHLMFCEDAIRKLVSFFGEQSGVELFDLKVEHQESLHAHNAVARFSGASTRLTQ